MNVDIIHFLKSFMGLLKIYETIKMMALHPLATQVDTIKH